MIHRAMIDVSAGHRWGFVLRVERDYDDDFAVIESPSYKIPGGVADELILDHEDEGRPLDRIYHPSHVRLPLWEGALAKVTRLDFRFNPEWPVALEGIELERSIAADNREDYMSPPEPFPPQEEHCPDLTCPPLGDDPPLPAPDEPEE